MNKGSDTEHDSTEHKSLEKEDSYSSDSFFESNDSGKGNQSQKSLSTFSPDDPSQKKIPPSPSGDISSVVQIEDSSFFPASSRKSEGAPLLPPMPSSSEFSSIGNVDPPEYLTYSEHCHKMEKRIIDLINQATLQSHSFVLYLFSLGFTFSFSNFVLSLSISGC